jgi:hypothetical protein
VVAGDAAPVGHDAPPIAADTPGTPVRMGPDVCLPPEEEKLRIRISQASGVLKDITGLPPGTRCYGRVAAPESDQRGYLSLNWTNDAPDPLSVQIAFDNVLPGMVGTFPASTVAIRNDDGPHFFGKNCQVTITTSVRLREEMYSASEYGEVFKIGGRVTCQYLMKLVTGYTLDEFEFLTRTTRRFIRY